MRENRTSGSMRGYRKRAFGNAPVFYSTWPPRHSRAFSNLAKQGIQNSILNQLLTKIKTVARSPRCPSAARATSSDGAGADLTGTVRTTGLGGEVVGVSVSEMSVGTASNTEP